MNFLELISRNLHHAYPFVIQRIIWKNGLEIIILENLISVLLKNVFGINFATIFSWSVDMFSLSEAPLCS